MVNDSVVVDDDDMVVIDMKLVFELLLDLFEW